MLKDGVRNGQLSHDKGWELFPVFLVHGCFDVVKQKSKCWTAQRSNLKIDYQLISNYLYQFLLYCLDFLLVRINNIDSGREGIDKCHSVKISCFNQRTKKSYKNDFDLCYKIDYRLPQTCTEVSIRPDVLNHPSGHTNKCSSPSLWVVWTDPLAALSSMGGHKNLKFC